MKRYILLAAMTAVLGAQASASLTLLGSRAQIAATADLGLGQFGAVGDTVTSGSIGTTTGIDVFDVKIDGPGDMIRLDQGNGWNGGFNNGEPLLWTNYTNGAVTFTQAKSATAVGLDLQRNYLGYPCDMTIEAFDGLGDSLGSYTVSVAAGAVQFLGVRSSDNNILSYTVNVAATDGLTTDFAFDHVSIECCQSVPEPATMAVLGITGLLALRRRKR